jgi:hypothetical protein
MAVADPNAPPQPLIPPSVQHQIDVLQARIEYPEAPADMLDLFNGDAAQIKAAAKRLHEMAVAAKVVPAPPAQPAPVAGEPAPAPAPAAPAVVPPAGGGPVPIPGVGLVQPPEHQVAARYQELLGKVERRGATEDERQEFFMMSLRGDNGEGWNGHIAKLRERPGRS